MKTLTGTFRIKKYKYNKVIDLPGESFFEVYFDMKFGNFVLRRISFDCNVYNRLY